MNSTETTIVIALLTCSTIVLLGMASSMRDIASTLRRMNDRQEHHDRRERLLRMDAENKSDPWHFS